MLRTVIALLLLGLAGIAGAEPRFIAVDVYIESDAPLAAWQFEFVDHKNATMVVGIENGDSAVFHTAPYYDREAVAGGSADRIVVADYSLAKRAELPVGRVRVATLHLMVSGDAEPDFASTLSVAATYGGSNIDAEISVEISGGREQ